MNKILLLFLSILFVTCTSDQEMTEEAPKLSLQVSVENSVDSMVTISMRGFKEELIFENGVASGEFEIPESGSYTIRHGRKHVRAYLENGKNVQISFNHDDPKGSFAIAGDLEIENQYLRDKAKADNEARVDNETKYSGSEEEFINIVQSDMDRQTEQLASIKDGENELSPSFLKMEENNILYQWANALLNFQGMYRYYSKDEEFEASEKINIYKSKINLNDADALSSSEFKRFTSSYLYKEASRQIEENEDMEGVKAMVHQFNIIPDLIENSKVKDHFYFEAISNVLDYVGVDLAGELVETFNKKCTNEDLKNKFKDKYDAWSELVKGKVAPVFAYPDLAGKMVSLEDFRGKNVYIDVWATWCGPCIAEQPHLEELQEKYKDSPNIIFASVSIDEDREAWEKMVREKELGGVHILADNAWSSGIVTDYLIKGIPRFMLIDTEGNILNVNAPRPSSDELKEVLAGLVEKT